MSYTPDATEVTQPADTGVLAATAAAEFRTLKVYLHDVILAAIALKAPITNAALVTPALGTPTSGDFRTGTFTWPTFNQSTSGNAATATYATSAGTAAAAPYNGLTGTVPTWNQNTTGNAATASAVAVGGITGLGTGVVTALAVNVGSAGAPVLNGGALGQPSSGNLASCTFPTLNQNTTGTAGGLTGTPNITVGSVTASSIDGVTVDTTTNKVVTAASLAGGTLPVSATTVVANGTNSGDFTLQRANNVGVGSEPAHFYARAPNFTGIQTIWTAFKTTVSNATAGTEAASFIIQTQQAGSLVDAFTVTGTGLNSTVIGATTPAAGSFTTLSATGAITADSYIYAKNYIRVYSGATEVGRISGQGADFEISSIGSAPITIVGAPIKTSSTIGVGGATPSASGAGITFPATQNASSDANTLDDYEEGTWTPGLTPGTSGSITLNAGTMTYTKIGNRVFLSGSVSVASVSSPVGILQINYAPFTASASSTSAVCVEASYFDAGTPGQTVQGRIVSGSTNMYLYWYTSGTPSNTLANSVRAGSILILGVQYSV